METTTNTAPVEQTSQPAATETAAPATNDASASTTAEFWDSYEALEKTPWLAELPEDRRAYLLGGAKQRFDDYETRLAEKAAEADIYRKFVEAENPEYFADRDRATKLEGEVKSARDEVVKAQAELERLKAEGASKAEIIKQVDEIKAAKEQLEQSVSSLKAENETLTGTLATTSEEFHQITNLITGLLFDHGHANVSQEARGKAKRAFTEFMADNVDRFDAEGKSMADLINAAWEDASKTIPKPDSVPASVRVQGGPSQRSTELNEEEIFKEYMSTKGDEPEKVIEKKFGLTTTRLMEILGRQRDKAMSRA